MPVRAVAIADCEEVQSKLARHVRHKYITVLIHFVRVIRIVADRSCVSEFRDAIEPLTRSRVPRLGRGPTKHRRLVVICLVAFYQITQIERVRLLQRLERTVIRFAVNTEYIWVESFLFVTHYIVTSRASA